jgi:hypothetical protein
MTGETLIMIEFFAFFGGILAFGFYQLWSLKQMDRRDREKATEPSQAGQP